MVRIDPAEWENEAEVNPNQVPVRKYHDRACTYRRGAGNTVDDVLNRRPPVMRKSLYCRIA